jgi:hypothetical protein
MQGQNRQLGTGLLRHFPRKSNQARTEAPGSIHSRKHTSTEERRGEFENPPPVLELDCFRPAETIERPANVPVEKDTRDIAIEHLVAEADDQGDQQAPRLLLRRFSTCAAGMQGANCECSCGGGREDELLAEDEVFAERDDEEDAEVTACKGQCQQLAKVSGRGPEQAQSVHGRNCGHLCQFDLASA